MFCIDILFVLRKDKELLARIAAKDINQDAAGKLPPVVGPRLWAMSDIHTDKKENMQWVLDLDPREFPGGSFGEGSVVTYWGEHVRYLSLDWTRSFIKWPLFGSDSNPAGGFNQFDESTSIPFGILVGKNDPLKHVGTHRKAMAPKKWWKNGRCFYVTEVPRGRSDPGWRYRKHHGGRGCEAPVDPKKQVPSGYGSRRLGPKPMFYIVLYYFTQIYSVRLVLQWHKMTLCVPSLWDWLPRCLTHIRLVAQNLGRTGATRDAAAVEVSLRSHLLCPGDWAPLGDGNMDYKWL